MLCLVLLLLWAGSSSANNSAICSNYVNPAQEVTLTTATNHDAQLPQVLQAISYSPVVHRVSIFLLPAPIHKNDVDRQAASIYTSSSIAVPCYPQNVPLHLAIRVLLI